MPELRKNIITREWVIIAKERSKRPEDFHKKEEKTEPDKAEAVKKCPFCPGNEHMTPDVILAYNQTKPDAKDAWDVKVVPNKYPALCADGAFKKSTEGPYDILNGVGDHEVIIETPDHFADIPFMSSSSVERIISVYHKRYADLMLKENLKHIIIFRNHGPNAGTSLIHPHSQLIATPVMPKDIFFEERNAALYYEYEERCPYCGIIDFEDQDGSRKISENGSFIAINPFFSRYPFETWIIPRKHSASFGLISDNQIKDLAQILQDALLRLHKCLDDPSYNLTLHSLVNVEEQARAYHWHFQIIPRLTTPAGFELGTGMFINTMPPEDAAKFLSEV